MEHSEYSRWLAQPDMPRELRDELESVAQNETQIADRFYRELEFGTGGLRGVLGAGSNRMNIYTVGKATQGLAEYILSRPGAKKRVAIAHDSRINSRLFAVRTARAGGQWHHGISVPAPGAHTRPLLGGACTGMRCRCVHYGQPQPGPVQWL